MDSCVVFPFGEEARIVKKSVQTMKFVLKQYDTELLSFEIRKQTKRTINIGNKYFSVQG